MANCFSCYFAVKKIIYLFYQTTSEKSVQLISSSLVGWTKDIKCAYFDGFPAISSNKVYYPRKSVKMYFALQLKKPGARYWKGCDYKYEHRDHKNYSQRYNISGTLAGNNIVDHSDVVGPSPVGDAPTTSSFST